MAGGQQFKKRLPMSIKNKYHFTELNEAQIEAVKTVNGPLLVLAGEFLHLDYPIFYKIISLTHHRFVL